MIKLSEKQIQKVILEYLVAVGIFAWRQNTGAVVIGEGKSRRFLRFGVKGMADILGVLPCGKLLAIEVKTKIGKVSPYQDSFLGEVRKRGGHTIVARSVEDVASFLKEYKAYRVEHGS